MLFQKIRTEEDCAQVQNILGVLPGGGHAHEGLVRVLHGRVGDAQVAMRHRMVHRFHDVMRRGVNRRQHLAELVEGRQVLQRRIAPHVLQVAQVGRSGHWHEDRVRPAKLDGLFGIAGVERDVGGNAGNQLPDVPSIKVHALAIHSRSCLLPVLQRNRVAEDHADLFEDAHGFVVNALDLLRIQRFDNRQVAGEGSQHGITALGSETAAGLAASAFARTGCAHDSPVVERMNGIGRRHSPPVAKKRAFHLASENPKDQDGAVFFQKK